MSSVNPIIHHSDQSTNQAIESGANPFMAGYSAKSDDAYLEALIASIEHPVINGVMFPRFPAAPMQERIHGHSNEHSLREAFSYFIACKRLAAQVGGSFGPDQRMLDFGSGWGRIVRLFLPQFALSNIVGFEPNPWFCQTARDLNPYITFINGGFSPPTILADGTFDIVTAWSVFSHLPEFLAKAWIAEFARLTRPGALLFLTTWGEVFLDDLAGAARMRTGGQAIHWYHESVLDRIGDIELARARFHRGEYVWVHGSDTYGEAVIPVAAWRRMVPSNMEVVAEDHHSTPQSLLLLRRK